MLDVKCPTVELELFFQKGVFDPAQVELRDSSEFREQ
jgi:hypothetical protein